MTKLIHMSIYQLVKLNLPSGKCVAKSINPTAQRQRTTKCRKEFTTLKSLRHWECGVLA